MIRTESLQNKEVFGIVPAVGAVSTPSPLAATSPGTTVDASSVKPRELPAMSGAGMYGSLQYNTMHQPPTTTASASTIQMRRN